MRAMLKIGIIALWSVLFFAGCDGNTLNVYGSISPSTEGEDGCLPSGELSALTVSPANLQLAPGARASIEVKATFSNGCIVDATESVYLTVDDKSVAKIGRDLSVLDGATTRYVEAISRGTATLTASTQKGGAGVVSEPVSVDVAECASGENAAVTALTLMPSYIQLSPNEAQEIHVYATWNSGCVFDATERVFFSVKDASIASIERLSSSSTGRVVVGRQQGTTSIQAGVQKGDSGLKSGLMTVVVSNTGGTTTPDAGNTEDPSEELPDAGAFDAGTPPPDAGVPDAGVLPEVPDAGVVPPDPPDAGPTVDPLAIKSLAIWPNNLTLSPVDRMPLQVVATQENGDVKDVTEQASFSTSNASVAQVISHTYELDQASIFLSAIAKGTATIEASYKDPISGKILKASKKATVQKRTTETRAIWVSRWNLGTSESDIRANIRKFADHGFNAVFFQVMGDGTAYYKSDILPQKSTSLDYLAVALDEARKQGVELHAYINALVGPNPIPTSGKHILYTHPEYICLTADGTQKSDGGYTWIAAEDSYIEHYKKVVRELVTRYEVDGVHVDRIRSPDKNTCHSKNLDEQYAKEKAAGTVSNWQEFYTGRVTKMAKAIYETVIANRPSALVSYAAWGIHKRFSGCTTSQGVDYNQDSVAWMEKGYADALCPMTYWDFGAYSGCTDWGRLADYFHERTYGRMLIMGMHAQDSGSVNSSKIAARIDYARNLDLAGTIIFASNYLSDANWDEILSKSYSTPKDPTPIVHR